VVGQELLQGRSDKDLAFFVTQFLTMMRPEHMVKKLFQTNGELRIAFLAALKLVAPQFPVPAPEAQAVGQTTEAMKQVLVGQPALVEQLGLVVQRFVQSKSAIDLNKWSQAADLTSERAAFVITNDLALAARYVQAAP